MNIWCFPPNLRRFSSTISSTSIPFPLIHGWILRQRPLLINTDTRDASHNRTVCQDSRTPTNGNRHQLSWVSGLASECIPGGLFSQIRPWETPTWTTTAKSFLSKKGLVELIVNVSLFNFFIMENFKHTQKWKGSVIKSPWIHLLVSRIINTWPIWSHVLSFSYTLSIFKYRKSLLVIYCK